MSDRKDFITISQDLTEEEKVIKEAEYAELRAKTKARLVTVLDRGMVGDRLHVPLPDDVYGEWVPNDKVEIHRYEALGFEVDKKYACSRSLHSDGVEGTSIVGDVIYMTCPSMVKELIEEIKQDNYDIVNAPRKSKEERDYEELNRKSVMTSVNKSNTSSVNVDQIKSALLQASS